MSAGVPCRTCGAARHLRAPPRSSRDGHARPKFRAQKIQDCCHAHHSGAMPNPESGAGVRPCREERFVSPGTHGNAIVSSALALPLYYLASSSSGRGGMSG